MNSMWLDEPPMYGSQYEQNQLHDIPEITNWRRTEFMDFDRLHELIRMKTYDIFGDVNPAIISENSCLSLVQINEIDEVVTNISLCNYPNVPSVPAHGWLEWISHHYGMHGITERNTMFIHMLLWDTRYNDDFYKRLLDIVFISNIHTQHVILIMPPWVAPARFNSEEDNGDIIPILDRESRRFKELYGEFYISEMMRYPDGLRQLVVAEVDGLATGILCLNKVLDIESLNQHFELGPYHGLRKPPQSIKIPSKDDARVTSNILFPISNLDLFNSESNSYGSGSMEEEMNEDWAAGDGNDIECSCSDYGGPCFKACSIGTGCPLVCKKVDTSTSEKILLNVNADNSKLNKSRSTVMSVGQIPYTSALKVLEPKISAISEGESVGYTEKLASKFIFDKHVSARGHRLNVLKTSRSYETGSVAQDALYKKVTTFAVDSRTFEAVLTSEKMTSSSSIQIAENLGYAPNRSSIMPSKIKKNLYTSQDSLARDEELKTSPTSDVIVEIENGKIVHRCITLPTYHSQSNAFTLELFSMREDIDERLSFDYLEAVFECFPDEDYCAVLIPPNFPTFPLLQHFVRVPLRFNKDYPLVLYLAHRATIVRDLRTREATVCDVTSAEELLAGIPKCKRVLEDFKFSLQDGSPYSTFVFICEGTIVGFAILCLEKEIELLRSRYQIDDYMSFDHVPIHSHAQIIHLLIMPIFASLHRYFFQELMRLSNNHALYYRLYHKDASALTRAEPLVTFLGEMIPVAPRRRLIYHLANYGDNQPQDFLRQDDKSDSNDFALYMMVPQVARISKIDINVRVVVVGASDCGLSVLESLAFGPNAAFVNFTNLTLISQSGIPFENRSDDVEKDELPFGGRYDRRYRHLIGTRAWINVVHGTLTAIHRKDKYITVSSMGAISYDYLVLTCGLQYQRPKFTKELRAERRGYTTVFVMGLELNDYPNPKNCLTINTERDAANCISHCARVFAENETCSVILCGRNIDCYSALAMLVKSGLPAKNIILVEPSVQTCTNVDNEIFFENDEVEEAVCNAIKEMGIRVLSGWDLVDWKLAALDDDFYIRVLILEQKTERRELLCDVFFNFREKTISVDTFLAICRCGLVFDGALVIDPEFQTNDPCIFAAGRCTKYSRKFYADQSSHKYHNLFEIGERLGQKLRNIIDSRNADEDTLFAPVSKLDMMLPVFRKPIITSCRLPGGYNYLNVKKPGKTVVSYDSNDVVLTTGYPTSSIGYFRLHFNQFNAVQTITCLSKKEFEVEHLINLYGKHETLLNDVKIRFQKSMVSNLYAYFREPWAAALFLDRFDCLRVENRATLLSSTVVCGDTLINDCTKVLMKSEWDALKPEDLEYIEARYAGSVYQEELENSLVDFLQHSEDHLPVYCNPTIVRKLFSNMEIRQDDPLFPKPNQPPI